VQVGRIGSMQYVQQIPLWGSLGFIAGIAIVSFVSLASIHWAFLILFTILFTGGAFLFRSFGRVTNGLLFLFLCLAGMWYGHMRMYPSTSPHNVAFYTAAQPSIEIEGKVSEEIRTGSRNVQIVIDAKRIYMESTNKVIQVNGKVLAFAPTGTKVGYGDVVLASGKLEKPRPFESFDYLRYLARRGISGIIFNADIVVLENTSSPHLYAALIHMRENLKGTLSGLVRGPPGEIVAAMALGYGRSLSDDTSQVLARSGIRHLTAISGMHVMLIIEMLLGILLYVGLRRQWAVGISIAIIFVFVLFVGFPASAVRAGIMGGLLYTGQVIGRPMNSFRLLLYAAVGMLVWNPYLLVADIGFQLSFAAIAGILTLAPFFEKNLSRFIPWQATRRITSMSLSATLSTFPLVLYHFGLLSWAGIFVNLIAIPLLPLILILAFSMLGAGSISFGLAAVISWPLWFIVSFVFSLASFVSSLPLALVLPAHSLTVLLVGYLFLGSSLVLLIKRGYNPILASSSFLYRN